ncbi:DUF2306 domain-containing protein [Chthonobacter albigriseus]|uniref:DUF2306 domain-containing protein n=1 Tax=Chthonobacter albigriseus TaxID=1683161 RepID=UPI0015EF5DE7|nr:DUF2306 domain-containing protein [Chthonobacter albigriseus]
MNLSPLLSAPPAVFWHAVAALMALGLGVLQMVGRKGTTAHRVLGWSWVGLMLAAAGSSFWIHGIDQFMGFSFIHVLSVWTLLNVPLAVWFARTGRVPAHARAMTWLFWAALVGAGIFTLMPGRRMGQVVFGW